MEQGEKRPEGDDEAQREQEVGRPEGEIHRLGRPFALQTPAGHVRLSGQDGLGGLTFILPAPVPVLAPDALGKSWLPALLLEIRNGVALVQIGEFQTVRSLSDICRVDGRERQSGEMNNLPSDGAASELQRHGSNMNKLHLVLFAVLDTAKSSGLHQERAEAIFDNVSSFLSDVPAEAVKAFEENLKRILEADLA
jgi:hypothetical protein